LWMKGMSMAPSTLTYAMWTPWGPRSRAITCAKTAHGKLRWPERRRRWEWARSRRGTGEENRAPSFGDHAGPTSASARTRRRRSPATYSRTRFGFVSADDRTGASPR
jgi:hypothetical protein